MNIDENSDLPKYSQLKEIIRDWAKSSVREVERKMPSERELVEKYNVSRDTVRRAISDLVAEGVLYREKGKGTFVAESPSPARQMPGGYPKSLGLIMPYTAKQDYLSNQVFRGVEEAARLNGYYVIFAVTTDSLDQEREIVQHLSNAGVQGLIILPANPDYEFDYEHIADLHQKKVAFILIDRFFRDLETDYVVTDNVAGAHKAVTHLIGLGHRRIGYITRSTSRATSVEDRLNGYRKALSEHGIPFRGEFVERYGENEDRLRAFIKGLEPPVAVFCLNDDFALKAMKIIREEGLKLPEDIALVGYDDVENTSLRMNLGLTTMRQPFFELGRVAVTKLLRRIRGEVEPEEPQQVVLTSTLVVRQSSGGSIFPASEDKSLRK